MLSGPGNRGSRAEESAFETLRVVFNLCRREGTLPFHVEGDRRAHWEDPRDGRSGNSQPLRQRVGKVVVVEVNLDGLVLHRDHPEHVVPVNVRVVVVNLLSEVGRSNRTGEQVKSNK